MVYSKTTVITKNLVFGRVFLAILVLGGLIPFFVPTAKTFAFEGLFMVSDSIYIAKALNENPLLLPRKPVKLLTKLKFAPFLPSQDVDCAVDPCIAFTFDDGPNPFTTPKILETLDRVYAHATFFVVGNQVANNSALLKKMHSSGHEVENHSWSHPDMTRLTVSKMREQIDGTQQAIMNAGLPAPKYFRPPYGLRNATVRQVVGMPFILWNIDTKDWQQNDAHILAQSILDQVRPGSIIILHDTKSVTVDALPIIMDGLVGKYYFVSVSELLKIPANDRGEYRGR